MVRKCGYLPLAIAVLGEILSRKVSLNEWVLASKDIYSCLKNGEGQGEQGLVEQVLALSYDGLPYHLKPCFLYLGFLGEDQSVDAIKLYNLWMGEGMILSKHKRRQEMWMDVAERYLGKLSNGCMVLVKERDDSNYYGATFGKFVSCRLHEVMRDFCQSKCRDEEFLNMVDDPHPISSSTLFENACRVAIMDGEVSYNNNEKICGQNLRSLLILTPSRRVEVGRFKLLRALFVERCFFSTNDSLDVIGQLIHLRYLGLIRCFVSRLPSSFINLSFLHTLDMGGTQVDDLPRADIFCKMKQLRYLHLPNAELKKKLILKGLYELEILISVNLYDIVDYTVMVGLKNLKILEVRVRSVDTLHPLLDCLNSSGINLKCSYISIWKCDLDSEVIKKMLTCKNLYNIRTLGCKILKLPDHDQLEDTDLSPSLVQIDFCDTSIMEDPLPMLGRLPNLRKLELRRITCEGGQEWSTNASAFPRLVNFKLYFSRVLSRDDKFHLRIHDDSMTNLSHLRLPEPHEITLEAPMRMKSLL